MKKIYTLILLSLIVMVGTAQVSGNRFANRLANDAGKSVVQMDKKALKIAEPEMPTLSTAPYAPYSFASFQKAMKAQQEAIATSMKVMYKRPDGVMLQGFTRDYRAYQSYLFTYSPAFADVLYTPYSNREGAEFSWYYNGGDSVAIDAPVDEEGVLTYTPSITPNGYLSYMPRVRATLADTTVSYVLGKGVTYQYMLAGYVLRDSTADGTVFDGTLEFDPMTIANMHINRPASGNLYNGFQDGRQFASTYSNEHGPLKGVIQVIPKQVSPLFVESMTVFVSNMNKTAVPEGGVLKLDLFYLNEDGSLGEYIAGATTDEFVNTTGEHLGVFIFKFEEEEDGFIIEKPITLGTEAPVVVRITGFDSTWNVNFLFGGQNGYPGSSYTLHGENPDSLTVSTFGYANAPEIPRCDLYIQFNGIYNCLMPFNDDARLDFPLEGGWGISGYGEEDNKPYNDIALYSSFNMDEDMTDVWIESTPDWIIGYEVDTTYYNHEQIKNILLFFFESEPLPDGVTGRSGDIVIASHGVTATIKAVQGVVSSVKYTAKPNIKVSVAENSFNVTYPADFNKVSIYTISGQEVARYPLSGAGQATIPVNAGKGVYLLKFSGAKTETVKVIK